MLPQDGPGKNQVGPKWSQDSPKMGQDGPRWPQDSPKMPQHGLKISKKPRENTYNSYFGHFQQRIAQDDQKVTTRPLKQTQHEVKNAARQF